MYLARFTVARDKDIHKIKWSDYANDHIRITATKNSVEIFVPLMDFEPLKNLLDTVERTSIYICTNSEGQPYKKETTLQQAVGIHLRDLASNNLVAKGLTLHGLRVTFGSEFRRLGFEDADIADLLGDKDPTMGKLYTRHVGRELTIKRAFEAKKVVKGKAK